MVEINEYSPDVWRIAYTHVGRENVVTEMIIVGRENALRMFNNIRNTDWVVCVSAHRANRIESGLIMFDVIPEERFENPDPRDPEDYWDEDYDEDYEDWEGEEEE